MRLLPMLLLLGARVGGGTDPRGAPPQSAPLSLPTYQLPHGRGLCDLRVGPRPLCDCDLARGRVNCSCPPHHQVSE